MRIFLVTALAIAAAGATASVAAPTARALVPCGKVAAAGKSWTVAAAGLACATARRVVGDVAIEKPDQVLHAQGGEIDRFAGSFSRLKCFRSRKAKLGAIQCTSIDGKKSVIAIYK
jgi:hypothetical protein